MLRNNLYVGKKFGLEILPLLEEIKTEKNTEKIQAIVELIQEKIRMIMESPADPYGLLIRLTPMEMRISSLIKNGYKNKDIAKVQNMTLNTVKTHRKNIRKKLGLHQKQINLASFLNITMKNKALIIGKQKV